MVEMMAIKSWTCESVQRDSGQRAQRAGSITTHECCTAAHECCTAAEAAPVAHHPGVGVGAAGAADCGDVHAALLVLFWSQNKARALPGMYKVLAGDT